MRRKWRRLDEPGLEVFHLTPDADGVRAVSTLVHVGADAFGLTYDWRLDRAWRTRHLHLRVFGSDIRELKVERVSGGWRVNGEERPDLATCDEIDLSATPFCNALAIRRLNGSGELTALYVDLPALRLEPSRQRYDALGGHRWHYTDLGAAKGFEADIEIDPDGLVAHYGGLFEAVR